MKQLFAKQNMRIISALGVSAGMAMIMLIGRFIVTGSLDYWFLPWNLFLGYLPLVFAFFAAQRLNERTRLFEWQNVVLTFLWLGFLPNSFYIVSDLIHLRETGQVSVLYDVVMLVAFTWSAFLAGFMSLYLMHVQGLRRFRARNAHLLVAATLLACSFAIYLGRYLRWNTWDILINPFGLLFDISERLINPIQHGQAFTTTLMFFMLLSSMYWSIYQLILASKTTRK